MVLYNIETCSAGGPGGGGETQTKSRLVMYQEVTKWNKVQLDKVLSVMARGGLYTD